MANAVEEVRQAMAMRILGALLIILSIIEFGIGGAVYGSLTNVHLGAWWVGVCTFIAGICGCISNNRSTVIAGSVISVFGVIIAIVGVAVDGTATGIIAAEKACSCLNTGKVYGNQDQLYNLEACSFSFSANAKTKAGIDSMQSASDLMTINGNYFYNHQYQNYYYHYQHLPAYYINSYYEWYAYYINNNMNYNYNYYYNHPYQNYYYHSHHNPFYYHNSYYEVNSNNFNSNYNPYDLDYDCICTDNSLCYGYTLGTLSDCGEILTTYTSLLSGSTAIVTLLCVICFIYSIFTCISCCNSGPSPTVVPVAGVQMVDHIMVETVVMPMGEPLVFTPQFQYASEPYTYAPVGYAQPVQYAPVGAAPQSQYAPIGLQQLIMESAAPGSCFGADK